MKEMSEKRKITAVSAGRKKPVGGESLKKLKIKKKKSGQT